MRTIDKAVKERVFTPRKSQSHKGDYGTVGFISGSIGMAGACVLNVQAAMRVGAGLTMALVPPAIYEVVEASSLETITVPFYDMADVDKLLESCDVIASGSGSANFCEYEEILRYVLKNAKVPLILDATALRVLTLEEMKQYQYPLIITPHMGEMSALVGHELSEDVAQEVAKKYDLIVVLKGSSTIIAFPDGEVVVSHYGNPGMATAGTGDVLCGVLAGIVAQHDVLEKSVQAGVLIHGLAGDLAVEKIGEYSLIASDLITYLPMAIRK